MRATKKEQALLDALAVLRQSDWDTGYEAGLLVASKIVAHLKGKDAKLGERIIQDAKRRHNGRG